MRDSTCRRDCLESAWVKGKCAQYMRGGDVDIELIGKWKSISVCILEVISRVFWHTKPHEALPLGQPKDRAARSCFDLSIHYVIVPELRHIICHGQLVGPGSCRRSKSSVNTRSAQSLAHAVQQTFSKIKNAFLGWIVRP